MTFGISAATLATVGASVAGAVISSNATGDAVAQQTGASDADRALRREQFERTLALQEPFRQGGLAAQNRLLQLMGLRVGGGNSYPGRPAGNTYTGSNPVGMRSDGVPNMLQAGADGVYAPTGGAQPYDAAAARARLAPQFTTGGGMEYVNTNNGSDVYGYQPTAGTVDEAGLQAAMQQEQQQGMHGQPGQGQYDPAADPEFGSTMQTFGAQQFAADGAPKIADFTPEDFKAGIDPGYAWRQSQGEQGLARLAAARGGLGSGRAMKDAMTFNQGLASQEYGAAFGRFQTNRLNKIGDYTGAFNRNAIERSSKLNQLQTLMNGGQSATNQVASAGQNYADGTAGANYNSANARGAGSMANGNSLQTAINGGVAAFNRPALTYTPTAYEEWQTTGNGMPRI